MAGDASAANMNAANSADTIVWISGANFGIGAGLARHVPWPGARIINLDLKPSPLYETVLFDLARPETWDTVRGHFESELATFRGKRAIFMVVGHANLARHGASNVTLDRGDGSRGCAGNAPYDVIVLTGSIPVLPHGLLDQLSPSGRLFAVIGERPIMNATLIRREPGGGTSNSILFDTVIAPLANCEHPARFRF